MAISEEAVATVSYVVFRILVPIIFVIGVLGNSFSVYVFTRKSMKCTANLYLMALAISDIGYLTALFYITFGSSTFVELHMPIYFQLSGLFEWILSSCDFISIYIVLSFTIERFIAIRYPLKRQTLCTESMAKKVIAGVVVFGILFNMVAFFDSKLDVTYELRDEDGDPCTQSFGVRTAEPDDPAKHVANSLGFLDSLEGSVGDFSMTATEGLLKRLRRTPLAHEVEANDAAARLEPTNVPPAIYWENDHKQEMVTLDLKLANFNEGCKNVSVYGTTEWLIPKTDLFNTIWPVVSLIVSVILPITVLAILNGFLVVMVRRSNKLREKMTNASSMIKSQDKAAAMSQENRVTIILIAVVVCFLVFQTPYAIILLLQILKVRWHDNTFVILVNALLFFSAVNATTNFFLYSVLSDKYRKAVRELLIGKGSKRERGTLTSSSMMTNTDASRGSYRLAPTSPEAF